MIQFQCKCGKKYEVPEHFAGKKVRCKKCDNTICVPSIENEDPASIKIGIIETESENNSRPDKFDNLIHFKCSQCKQELEAPEVMRGKTILCHHCQSSVEVLERQIETERQEEPLQLTLKKETKSCPYCGEKIFEVAQKCKHCGEFLDKVELNESHNKQDLSQNGGQVLPDNGGTAPLIGFFVGLLFVNFMFPLGLAWLCNYEDQIKSENTETWCLVGQIINGFSQADELDDIGCAPCTALWRLSNIGGILLLLFGGFMGMGVGASISNSRNKNV